MADHFFVKQKPHGEGFFMWIITFYLFFFQTIQISTHHFNSPKAPNLKPKVPNLKAMCPFKANKRATKAIASVISYYLIVVITLPLMRNPLFWLAIRTPWILYHTPWLLECEP